MCTWGRQWFICGTNNTCPWSTGLALIITTCWLNNVSSVCHIHTYTVSQKQLQHSAVFNCQTNCVETLSLTDIPLECSHLSQLIKISKTRNIISTMWTLQFYWATLQSSDHKLSTITLSFLCQVSYFYHVNRNEYSAITYNLLTSLLLWSTAANSRLFMLFLVRPQDTIVEVKL